MAGRSHCAHAHSKDVEFYNEVTHIAISNKIFSIPSRTKVTSGKAMLAMRLVEERSSDASYFPSTVIQHRATQPSVHGKHRVQPEPWKGPHLGRAPAPGEHVLSGRMLSL